MASIKTFSGAREWRVVALAAALALSGCSMSIPALVDRAPTGSVKSPTYPFADEDWAKAEPALIAAIRAEDTDTAEQWTSEASGRRGAVIGVGGRFARGAATCRAFVARIRDGEDSRAVSGSACEKAGAVTLSDVGPFKG